MHLPEPNQTALQRRSLLSSPNRLSENRTFDTLDTPLPLPIPPVIVVPRSHDNDMVMGMTMEGTPSGAEFNHKYHYVLAKERRNKERKRFWKREKKEKTPGVEGDLPPAVRGIPASGEQNEKNEKNGKNEKTPMRTRRIGRVYRSPSGHIRSTCVEVQIPSAFELANLGEDQDQYTNPGGGQEEEFDDTEYERRRRQRRSSGRRSSFRPRAQTQPQPLQLLPSLDFETKEFVDGLLKPGMFGNDITEEEIENALGEGPSTIKGGSGLSSVLEDIDMQEQPDTGDRETGDQEHPSQSEVESLLTRMLTVESDALGNAGAKKGYDGKVMANAFVVDAECAPDMVMEARDLGFQAKMSMPSGKCKEGEALLIVARDHSSLDEFLEDMAAGKIRLRG